jgi:hypothetical protein
MQRPKPIVRARQRDRRGTLAGFDRNLAPTDLEWAVDRIIIQVDGHWESATSGTEFFESRLSDPALENWFRAPSHGSYNIEVQSRSPRRSTLGDVKLVAKNVARSSGAIAIEISANPTRTLASLMARYPPTADFLADLADLPSAEFFAIASEDVMPRSLDNDDNWLPDPSLARAIIGHDAFGAFLPVYVRQLQRVLLLLLCETPGEGSEDGADQVFRASTGRVRLRWGMVRVPQIESYFERFHSRAIEAVRTAGMALLTGDHSSTVRRYARQLDLERDADCFRINMRVSGTRKLVVYAKRQDRIRFEVRRDGRGRYNPTQPRNTTERLLSIIGEEKAAASRLNWHEIGELFDDPDTPILGDLIELICATISACGLPDGEVRPLLHRLLIDGGLSVGLSPALPRGFLRRLRAAGVIREVKPRPHDLPNSPERYSLTPHYRDVRERLVANLLTPP